MMFFAAKKFLAAAAVAAVMATAAAAADAEQAQPYEKIRYPTFAGGRLQSLLEADQAEAYDVAVGTPRIVLRNVVITQYDHAPEVLAATPDDQPLPIKVRITSDRGFFTRRPPEPGSQPEDIANLEGNVLMRQYRGGLAPTTPAGAGLRPSRLPAGVDTEIRCEHAQWNNTLRKLNGDGEVEFIQEDSRIFGTGFLYLADDDSLEAPSGGANLREWGGIVFIEHNARMEIDRDAVSGASGKTEITCRDTASYKLREREIQFEREVKIRRPGLLIEADILKVFLRRADEISAAGATGPAMPGEVRSIVATIGTRPGSVVVTGYKIDPSLGREVVQYTAKGGRADFDYDTNRIALTDGRDRRKPEVEFGSERDRISDRNLVFVLAQVASTSSTGALAATGPGTETVLDNLHTSGGQGEVALRSRDPAPDAGPSVPTLVNYQGDMTYNRRDGRIRFQDSVNLRRGELQINSGILDVRLSASEDAAEPGAVNRILAETDVDIVAGTYRARAQRAEYDIYSGPAPDSDSETGVDTLRLYGPPQGQPPFPWIRDEAGNQISAPEVHMQRRSFAPGMPEQHLMVARGGVSVADFVAQPAVLDGTGQVIQRAKIVSVKCEHGMEYNQKNRKARFEGQVMATSDAPEDSYVLTSDRLLIDFDEAPDPANPGEYVPWIRRITAEGTARLMQDARVCEAVNIIRDFPENDPESGDIYLQGAPATAGRPPVMAIYREQTGTEIGSMFAALLIKSSATGDLIQANGPGQLSMPDDVPGLRSEIHFDGAASYEMFHDGMASEARFWRGVTLRQPSSSILISSDELTARFLQDPSAPAEVIDDAEINLQRIGRLRRAEGRGGVRVEHSLPRQGHRVAIGDVGVVEINERGSHTIRLTADRSTASGRFVMARDHDGLTLRAPEIEVRQELGFTRASGPGDLQIPGDAAATGMSREPTRVLYGERGAMVYNELALNIRVSDSVRVVQPGAGADWSRPGLDSVCDRMEITLLEPPAAGLTNQEALSRVRRMDAIGGVVIRVYAESPADNPTLDWASRPGTTFFTRGDQGVYDVQDGRIVVSCMPGRQPQLLLNMIDTGSAPRRQRLRADRFVLQTDVMPRRWNFEGQLESNTLQEGEPFDFLD